MSVQHLGQSKHPDLIPGKLWSGVAGSYLQGTKVLWLWEPGHLLTTPLLGGFGTEKAATDNLQLNGRISVYRQQPLYLEKQERAQVAVSQSLA